MNRLVPILFLPATAFALEPAEVIVLVNKNVPESKAIADHYLKARGIPAENVVTLDLPKGEDISRKEYDEKLVPPLREAIKDRKEKVKCLLCAYGVPLRVGGDGPTDAEREELKKLEPQIKEFEEAAKTAEA